jgi:hypothetical protein
MFTTRLNWRTDPIIVECTGDFIAFIKTSNSTLQFPANKQPIKCEISATIGAKIAFSRQSV